MKTSQPLDLRTGLHLLLYAFSGSLTAYLVPLGTAYLTDMPWARPFPWLSTGSLFLLSFVLLLIGQTAHSIRCRKRLHPPPSTLRIALRESSAIHTASAVLLFVCGSIIVIAECDHDLGLFGWTAATILVASAGITKQFTLLIGALRCASIALGFLFQLKSDYSALRALTDLLGWIDLFVNLGPIIFTTMLLLMALKYRAVYRLSEQWPFWLAILGSFAGTCGAGVAYKTWLLSRISLGVPAELIYYDAELGWALAFAFISLMWFRRSRGRPAPSADLHEPLSWISGILIAVDASYLIAMNRTWEYRLIFIALTPLFVAQLLVRRFAPKPPSAPRQQGN